MNELAKSVYGFDECEVMRIWSDQVPPPSVDVFSAQSRQTFAVDRVVIAAVMESMTLASHSVSPTEDHDLQPLCDCEITIGDLMYVSAPKRAGPTSRARGLILPRVATRPDLELQARVFAVLDRPTAADAARHALIEAGFAHADIERFEGPVAADAFDGTDEVGPPMSLHYPVPA